jgi:(heptosyl)LPS beta-1,4-glucosyltransferase
MLTAIVLTYNESRHITACLNSLRFADHLLVYDSFSTDDTVVLAQQNGAQVIQRRFQNYAQQRNDALEVAGGADWVLFVDADERISTPLADEIEAAVARADHAAYQIPRHNYIFGKLARYAGWYPDYQTRLLKVGRAQYDPARPVHEVVLVEGSIGTLQNPIVHHNYTNLAQFHAKQQRYAAYDAQILHAQGVRAKPHTFILQPWRHFWWRYVTLKGYSGGLHGLHLSLLMASYEFYKYRRLAELG